MERADLFRSETERSVLARATGKCFWTEAGWRMIRGRKNAYDKAETDWQTRGSLMMPSASCAD